MFLFFKKYNANFVNMIWVLSLLLDFDPYNKLILMKHFALLEFLTEI